MSSAKTVTACILVIGNEILSGRTKDANLAWLAVELNKLGVRLMEARVIPDIEGTIVETINAVRGRFDYVFTTGGIGPTHDDITAACVAKAFGVPLIRNPDAVRRLQAHYANPADLNEARLRMANAPEGAELIDNPVSKAPGFRIGNVYVMAGVPTIMQAMFDGLRHRLVGGAPMLSRSISVDLPEGVMATQLAAIQETHGEVEIGSYPYMRLGKPGAAIVLRSVEAAGLAAATEAVKAMMRALGGEPREDPGNGG
ncbi:MAG: competence/damage-inducible protein A [Alphaproteobacteria bacterium]|nr:competence/damage-inducible protein A [Alphaproteobacteria bacterium]